MLHELKTDPDSFDAIWAGDKTCEIRYDDRGYALMDELILRRTRYSGEEMKKGKPLKYTGGEILAWITHILRGPAYGLRDGYILASIKIRKRKLMKSWTAAGSQADDDMVTVFTRTNESPIMSVKAPDIQVMYQDYTVIVIDGRLEVIKMGENGIEEIKIFE